MVQKHSQLLRSTKIYHGQPAGKRLKVIDWIGKHTTGRFYYGDKNVYFENEIDATMFKLGFKI